MFHYNACESHLFFAGTINKFIRRLHEYPLRLKSPKATLADILATKAPSSFAAWLVLHLEGTHNTDELCCELDLDLAQLSTLLSCASSSVLLIK